MPIWEQTLAHGTERYLNKDLFNLINSLAKTTLSTLSKVKFYSWIIKPWKSGVCSWNPARSDWYVVMAPQYCHPIDKGELVTISNGTISHLLNGLMTSCFPGETSCACFQWAEVFRWLASFQAWKHCYFSIIFLLWIWYRGFRPHHWRLCIHWLSVFWPFWVSANFPQRGIYEDKPSLWPLGDRTKLLCVYYGLESTISLQKLIS